VTTSNDTNITMNRALKTGCSAFQCRLQWTSVFY